MLSRNGINQPTLISAIDAFLADKRASGKSSFTLRFYTQFLTPFQAHFKSLGTALEQITPGALRGYFLTLVDSHTQGGVHAAYRTIRAFFHWLEAEEGMPEGWKNPIHKVKIEKPDMEPLEPVALDDVNSLLLATKQSDNPSRDKAVVLVLLDTGLRASEFCRLNIDDVDGATGAITIRKSKSHKPRSVFISRITRRAVRAYLKTRRDNCPALFVTRFSERLGYPGLREIIRRLARSAHLEHAPSLHAFRRAFALNFLRAGGNVFDLQRLMGHSDLSVLKRYLAQDDTDSRNAHSRFSPVDRLLKGGDDNS